MTSSRAQSPDRKTPQEIAKNIVDEHCMVIGLHRTQFVCDMLENVISQAIAQERATLVLPDHEAIKKEALKRNYSYGTKPYMAFILGGQYACDLIDRLNAPRDEKENKS